MTKQNYIFEHKTTLDGSPIKHWTKGVVFDGKARKQLREVATLPFIHGHVAAMPDVHWGYGAPIGTVIPTRGAIVPAAVGVDIGCGMIAVLTTLTASDLPDNLGTLRSLIEKAVPHGRTDSGGPLDRGAWGDPPINVSAAWGKLQGRYQAILDKHPKARAMSTRRQLGTLGSGNHFIEVCLDENDRVWAMLHSGSRGPGNKIGTYFINKAKEEMAHYFIHLPNKDLAYLVEGSGLFDDYVEAVEWAQDFALVNRQMMMEATLNTMRITLPEFELEATAINCHHNYIAKEHHFGANVWVTRKGAVRARKGDLGIIPGSMGERSFIVRGLSNKDSFHSCSHGAGRVMSRGQAKREFTLADHEAATVGIECRKDDGVLDETPGAYKDIDAVMAAQSDLVEVVHTLRQVLCVKG